MLELRECLKIRHRINYIDMRITELREIFSSPKIQILSLAPSFSKGNANNFDRYLVKIDYLKEEREYLEERISEVWSSVEDKLKEEGVKRDHILLMKLRFYHGLPWKECGNKMKINYPKELWNEQKVYRVYRNVKDKAQNF